MAEVEAGEENLTVVGNCPNCGGRVSGLRDEKTGKVSAMCMGTIGEEKSCGWATDDSSVAIVPVKRTA